MINKRSILTIIGLLAALLAFSACIGTDVSLEVATTDTVTYDREGYPIALPNEINTIISIGPSNTEILVELGFGDQIVATDIWSDVAGVAPDINVLDMFALDAEFILDTAPDIIFIAGMTRVQGDDHPLRAASDAGIAVIYIPPAISIAEIKEDIRFIASVMGVETAGLSIVAAMEAEIEAIADIAETIAAPRTVYFEISPAPHMWAVGGGNFQHEMLELAGAINIFADEDAWIGVSDEMFLMYNPDVILTSTNFIDDPIGEIMGRPGWDAITAVQNGDVFLVDTDITSRQSHNIVHGLWDIARAIYPEYFE